MAANPILLTTLGESPIVVTATARKLLADGVPLSTVRVAYPADDVMISMGFDMIVEALSDVVTVEPIALPFADPASYADSLTFLQHMNGWLEMHQQQGDAVYLSLAGGRKNMSALLSVMAQFYPCVQKLLHVHDRTNSHFINLNDLYGKPDAARNNLLNPPVADFDLIEIPFQQLASADELRKMLKQTTTGDVNEIDSATTATTPLLPDATAFFEKIFSGLPARPLTIRFTQTAFDQASEWLHGNSNRAQRLQGYIRVMSDAEQLAQHEHNHDIVRYAGRNFHFCKRGGTGERPFYYAKLGPAHVSTSQ